MAVEKNEVSEGAQGGTELMLDRLHASLPESFLDKYQIIPSRVRALDDTKLRVYYVHDLPSDPEAQHLENGGWSKFHRLVFVSHYQRNAFMGRFNIPWSKTAVLLNAIQPIPLHEKPADKINLIYHTTPHRGLVILVPVFAKLAEKYGDKVHLDVYSSFKMYGWEERDKEFEPLFKQIKEHPQMTYHGFRPNVEVREALQKAHIFAYPSIWPETSCLALMEAMSAKCVCIHPDYAALPETASNLTFMYQFHEDINHHAGTFYGALSAAVELLLEKSNENALQAKVTTQKVYADLFYNWENRKLEWESFLKSFEKEPLVLEKVEEYFTYRA